MSDLHWLRRLGDYEVVRREIPRPGGKPYCQRSPRVAVVARHFAASVIGEFTARAWRGTARVVDLRLTCATARFATGRFSPGSLAEPLSTLGPTT